MPSLSQKCGTVVLVGYFFAQYFASFPHEFLGGVLVPAHLLAYRSMTKLGLSPGLGVFDGNLPEPARAEVIESNDFIA